MTAALDPIACPMCGAELTVAQIFANEDAAACFTRLAHVSIPLGSRVLAYLQLHAPVRQRLTLPKQIKLILQLLPDLERQAITFKGRDWSAPHMVWAQAIDQMLLARDTSRLELPMKGHGYLYAIVASLADKHEAAAEQQREQDHRLRPQRDTVQVKGQTMAIGDALDVVYGGKDKTLADLDARDRQAAPMPEAVRARIAAMRGKGGQA